MSGVQLCYSCAVWVTPEHPLHPGSSSLCIPLSFTPPAEQELVFPVGSLWTEGGQNAWELFLCPLYIRVQTVSTEVGQR